MAKKIAVVTGASSGIGYALTQQLAKAGLKIIAIARRVGPIKSLRLQFPDDIEAIKADLSTSASWRNIVDLIKEKQYRLDYLVHNAATLEPVIHLKNLSYPDWQRHFTLNLETPLFLTQQLYPFFNKPCRILIMTSGALENPEIGVGCYCVSKTAVKMLQKCLKQELEAEKIYVGCVNPPFIKLAESRIPLSCCH